MVERVLGKDEVTGSIPVNGSISSVILDKSVGVGPVAQLVEHCTFNAVVAGSSPARLTI